jgi:hypothetical protein
MGEEPDGSEVSPSSFNGALADALSVGHHPPEQLAPQDEALFRAFQSNLLSLISHELRTPLMGILNALGLLEEGGDSGELSATELIRMARQNALRLNHSLASLLDLAALDSGSFHARFKEVDLHRLVSGRLDAHRPLFRDRNLRVEETADATVGTPVLADPQKLGRALDLWFQVLVPRAETGSEVKLRISSNKISLSFQLTSGNESLWDAAWSQALAGYQGGVASPSSAFGGVMQSEQAFLTRMEEGLGSEFLLIHEILRIHFGQFEASREGLKVTLEAALPELSSEEGLMAVLASRAYEISTELGTVALVLLQVPHGTPSEAFAAEIKKSLFRASDAVYSIPKRQLVALVLDDCKPEDAPRLMERIGAKLNKKGVAPLVFGAAQCPADGLDPAMLLPLAESRLRAAANSPVR